MQALFVGDINMREYVCVCGLCGAKLISSFAVVLPAAYVQFVLPAAYVLQEMCLCVSYPLQLCSAHMCCTLNAGPLFGICFRQCMFGVFE